MGNVAANSFRLILLKDRLSRSNVDVLVLGDSLGLGLDDRLGTYTAWIMEHLGGALPVRVGAGAGNWSGLRRFGMGIDPRIAVTPTTLGENINGDAFVNDAGTTRPTTALGALGLDFTFDGQAYAQNEGRLGLIFAQATKLGTPNTAGINTGGALVNVIQEPFDHSVLLDLMVQEGSNGFPDRTFEIHDGLEGSNPLATFNPTTDIAGYPHLPGEDPDASRGAPVTDRMGRVHLSSPVNITDQLGNGTIRATLADQDDRINDNANLADLNESLAITGMVMHRADSNGDPVDGSSITLMGGGSAALRNFSENQEPSSATNEVKNISEDAFTHAFGAALPNDQSRPLVIMFELAIEPDGGDPAAFEEAWFSDLVSMLDILNNAAAANGRTDFTVGLVTWYAQGSRTAANMQAAYNAMERAAKERSFAASLTLSGLLDNIVFDGSQAAIDWLSDNGFSAVTFGNVTDGDISDGLLMDGTDGSGTPDGSGPHPLNETANAFFTERTATAIDQSPGAFMSIRERIEEEIARKVAAVTGLTAERWNGLRGQSSSTVDTTVVTVSAGEEENSNEAAGGSGAVTVYTLTVDMTCEIVQPETDTTPTATRVNAVVSEILAAVLTDPNLTETATGAPGEPLAIDTEYRSVEGPIADERAEGSSFVNISVDVTYQTFRDDPTTAPGISERT